MDKVQYFFYENKNFYILRCSDFGTFFPKSKINWVIARKKTDEVRSFETSALNYDGTSSVFVSLFLFLAHSKKNIYLPKIFNFFELLDGSVLAFDVEARTKMTSYIVRDF